MIRCLSLFIVILAATAVTHGQSTMKLSTDDTGDDYCLSVNDELFSLAAGIESIKQTLSFVDGKI